MTWKELRDFIDAKVSDHDLNREVSVWLEYDSDRCEPGLHSIGGVDINTTIKHIPGLEDGEPYLKLW